VFTFIKSYESEEALKAYSSKSLRTCSILFNQTREGMATEFKSLKGNYKFIVRALLLVPGYSEVEDPYTVVTGSVSGLLGTDDSKRDIFSGLVAGLKWALIIGL